MPNLTSLSRCLGGGRDWCRRPRAEFLAPDERAEKRFVEGSDNMEDGLGLADQRPRTRYPGRHYT